jgi:O-acetylserine/cysteine efflux transporter
VVLGATFFGFGSWAWLLRRHPASRVVPFALLVPVAGIASAWVALGEQPNTAELVGAGIVLAGLTVATVTVTASDGRSSLRTWPPPFRSRPSVSVPTSSQR